ncbi:MAG: hypothetical protein IJ715_03460 [Bacilli bacterium]|nr:hypothetical protein [Bacilli bacterium]
MAKKRIKLKKTGRIILLFLLLIVLGVFSYEYYDSLNDKEKGKEKE